MTGNGSRRMLQPWTQRREVTPLPVPESPWEAGSTSTGGVVMEGQQAIEARLIALQAELHVIGSLLVTISLATGTREDVLRALANSAATVEARLLHSSVPDATIDATGAAVQKVARMFRATF